MLLLWPVAEAAVTVLCTPDNGCDGHPKHVESDFTVNKYLHTAATCWILLICRAMYSTFVIKRIRNNGQCIDYATDWTIRFSNPCVGKIFFSCPKPPNRFWGPSSLLFIVHKDFFPKGQSDRGVNLTSHLHIGSTWRLGGAIFLPPLCLHSLDRDRFNFL